MTYGLTCWCDMSLIDRMIFQGSSSTLHNDIGYPETQDVRRATWYGMDPFRRIR